MGAMVTKWDFKCIQTYICLFVDLNIELSSHHLIDLWGVMIQKYNLVSGNSGGFRKWKDSVTTDDPIQSE